MTVTWEQFHGLLQDIGPNDVTIELVLKGCGCRFVVPRSYSTPPDGFDELLHGKWLVSYRDARCLAIFPACLRNEYFDRFRTELCRRANGMSEGAFKLMYEDETMPVRIDDRRRWQIPSRLFRQLCLAEEDKCLCLRSGYAWIEIRPKKDDDVRYEEAKCEAERASRSLSHGLPGTDGDTHTLPYPKRGHS